MRFHVKHNKLNGTSNESHIVTLSIIKVLILVWEEIRINHLSTKWALSENV